MEYNWDIKKNEGNLFVQIWKYPKDISEKVKI